MVVGWLYESSTYKIHPQSNLNNPENSEVLTLTPNEHWERDNLLTVLWWRSNPRVGVKPDTPEGRIG